VEWVGLSLLVALLLAAAVTLGIRLPGTALVEAIASRLLCATAMADSCGDETRLIAAYGSELGRLVAEQMPSLAFEARSRAVPVDFRRCRRRACGDGPPGRLVLRTETGLPLTAFVHVVDCRAGDAEEPQADCSGRRAGNLYVQYWTYYPESATLRGVPVLGAAGYHRDDWESLQVRIGPDGEIAQRASSHHGYNHAKGFANAGSDVGIGPLRGLAEALGVRRRHGWGPRNPLLFVSGGSHAGNVGGVARIERVAPSDRIRLVPLEPIAAADRRRFAVSPPWRKRVWTDPEASGTD